MANSVTSGAPETLTLTVGDPVTWIALDSRAEVKAALYSVRKGGYQEAHRQLGVLMERYPEWPQPWFYRAELLMSMGLFDEAADSIPRRYDLLTRSLALNWGGASRDSIYEIEVFMSSVPRDYVPQLLPLTVRELLYPRHFYDAIVEDARRFDADPTLLLAIMREESRFNPRAKSEAAARGFAELFR